MTESRYAIPVEDLVDSARVPVAEQVVDLPERRVADDWSNGLPRHADGMSGDADGE